MKEQISNDLNSNSAPIINLSEKQRKEFIISNYLPNLSQYQIITKTIKDKQIKLAPNVNFTNQKDFFIFYNDNLMALTELYKLELKRYIELHNIILYFKKNNLLESINSGTFNIHADKDFGPLKLISKIISGGYQETVEHANITARNLSKLFEIKKKFGDAITLEKMCVVTVSEQLFDEEIGIKTFLINNKEQPKHNYLKYIKEIEDIKVSELEIYEKVKLLDEKIENYKKEINPENSINDMNDFCFILNKISDYLRNLERSFDNKELKLLEKMDYLRRKVDYYLLEFRFKFVENEAPILNIKIQRYKILCDSEEIKSIFLESGQINNFIISLKDELDRKAKNINSNYQFQDIHLKEFIKIAQEIDFNKFEDLINNYQNKIYKLEEQLKSKKIEFTTDVAKKVSSQIIGLSFNNFGAINITNNGKSFSLSDNVIENFLKSDNKLKEEKKELEKSVESENGPEKNKSKNNKHKKEKKTKKLKKEDTKKEDAKKEDIKEEDIKEEDKKKEEINNENKINEEEIKNENKINEEEINNENIIKETSENKENVINETNQSKKILEKRKNNLNALGINPVNFTNEIIDNISKAFQMYHDIKNIQKSIEQNKNIKAQLQTNLKYNLDYFNALKLYCYILKKRGKDEIYGIILEEKRTLVPQELEGKKFYKEADNLREYSIYKLNKFTN